MKWVDNERAALLSFSYDGYRRLLQRLRQSHVCARFDKPLPEDKPFVLLRHDIDFSLESAVQMAELEANECLNATYFVLFSSPFYNPLEAGAESALRRITMAGHAIGLHYDAAVMERQSRCGDLHIIAQAQAALLSAMTGNEVRCVAMHNPSLHDGADPLAANNAFINASGPRFQTGISYHSDSCGAWRTASLDALTGAELPTRLHLLIHPVLWSSTGGTRWEHLDACAARRHEMLGDATSWVAGIWNAYPAVREHDSRAAAETG